MNNDVIGAGKLLDELTNRLPSSVDSRLKNMPSLTLYQVVCLRDTLAHRIRDLSEKVAPLFESNQLMPAFLVTRALLETVSLLYELHKKVVSAIERKEVNQLGAWLERVALGRKNVEGAITPPNILNALDSMNAEYAGVREIYDQLSEYCHPNFAGVIASYSRVNVAGDMLLLGPHDEPPMTLGSTPYLIALKLTVHYYDRISRNLNGIRCLTGCPT